MQKTLYLLSIIIGLFLLVGCTKEVESYEIPLNIENNEIAAEYTGVLDIKNISGQGKVLVKIDKSSSWTYEGTVTEGRLTGSASVNNMPFTLEYENLKLQGIYSGDLNDGIPSGKGIFKSNDNDIELYYDGEWRKGKLYGDGVLKTNHYVIQFKEVERIGNFEGTTIDGRAYGEGVFIAENDYKQRYTYTGAFKAGTFNGDGKMIFDDKEIAPSIGTFTDGDFTPNKVEQLAFWGKVPDFFNFELTNETVDFINQHPNLFMATSIDELKDYYDENISLNELYKKPYGYPDCIVSISRCDIFQIMEIDGYKNDKVTWFLANDRQYNTLLVIADSELENVNKNSIVTTYGLPIGIANYKNAMGAEVSAYVIYASLIK